jgi:hypothetical protein
MRVVKPDYCWESSQPWPNRLDKVDERPTNIQLKRLNKSGRGFANFVVLLEPLTLTALPPFAPQPLIANR